MVDRFIMNERRRELRSKTLTIAFFGFYALRVRCTALYESGTPSVMAFVGPKISEITLSPAIH